jgi:hypothetical protein
LIQLFILVGKLHTTFGAFWWHLPSQMDLTWQLYLVSFLSWLLDLGTFEVSRNAFLDLLWERVERRALDPSNEELLTYTFPSCLSMGP